jgi:hypothetical protein
MKHNATYKILEDYFQQGINNIEIIGLQFDILILRTSLRQEGPDKSPG